MHACLVSCSSSSSLESIPSCSNGKSGVCSISLTLIGGSYWQVQFIQKNLLNNSSMAVLFQPKNIQSFNSLQSLLNLSLHDNLPVNVLVSQHRVQMHTNNNEFAKCSSITQFSLAASLGSLREWFCLSSCFIWNFCFILDITGDWNWCCHDCWCEDRLHICSEGSAKLGRQRMTSASHLCFPTTTSSAALHRLQSDRIFEH